MDYGPSDGNAAQDLEGGDEDDDEDWEDDPNIAAISDALRDIVDARYDGHVMRSCAELII